ncbi:hypothetical protein P8452_06256 [Trifolium repens]|nr:hypothetical protein P8452_06256 [Trifolium repens]
MHFDVNSIVRNFFHTCLVCGKRYHTVVEADSRSIKASLQFQCVGVSPPICHAVDLNISLLRSNKREFS